MGDVKKILGKTALNDREKHNSRLFIDLCENIHIHYREYRHVFSLPEFFEYVDIVEKSARDVRNYLRNNPDYEESRYSTTIMVAGGVERQMKFLENSPQPNQSYYMDSLCRIELNEEYVTDEIHVHYRDFRIAMNRENFKILAGTFKQALDALETHERDVGYVQLPHTDRVIDGWQQSARIEESNTQLAGVEAVRLTQIHSKWYDNIESGWSPDRAAIDILKAAFNNKALVPPVVLSEDGEGGYLIVDGHHRVRAALEAGQDKIDAVVTDLAWEETEHIRRAEQLLKTFDDATDYRYGMSKFFKSYTSDKLNRYYKDHFTGLITPPGAAFRFFRGIKRAVVKMPLPASIHSLIIKVSNGLKGTIFKRA